jgi:hypothetical protein
MLGLFTLGWGATIFPSINQNFSVDDYAYSFLLFFAGLIYINRVVERDDSTFQKFMKHTRVIIACVGLVCIVHRPLAEGMKCYEAIIGCPSSTDYVFESLKNMCVPSIKYKATEYCT